MKLLKISMFLFFILFSCKKERTIALVENGVSNYEIVFISKAISQYQSAELLKTYIDKISGTNIAIVDESSQSIDKQKIYIGNSANEALKKHELSIKIVEQNLYISGGSDEAIQNAVLIFLEKYLGCRWYAPDVERIPILKSITLDKSIDYNYTPEITTRTVHSRLFYENLDFTKKLKVTTLAFPHYVPSARVHTFNKFIPEEKFYKKHPEYFALRGKKRVPTQLCLTNDKVFEIVKDSVASLFKNNPSSSVVSVSQNDNQQYCQCNRCSKIDSDEGGPSGTMIQFVNKIAAEFPNKTISTLAYQYTRKPSKTKPLKNVLITLCSIECDRSAPITEKCTEFADDLRGWNKISNNIRIWDYTTQFTNFLAPFPNILTLQPNIQFFRDNSAKWIFEQHSNNPSELFELRSYLTAKLLWNPDENADELITEFTNEYYQEAGIYIKKYIDLIHKKIQEDDDFFLFLYGDPSQAFDSYLNPELLKMYNELYDTAEKAVANSPKVLQRVKEARLSIDFATLEAFRKNLSKDFTLTKLTNLDKKIINPIVENKLKNFEVICKNANITLMNEMSFSVQDYIENYKKALETAVLPNKALGKKVTLLTRPKKYANEDPQVLTDGVLGGNSFYANWLGFEGNHMEAIIDLDSSQLMSSISTAFLQVTNHVVFFPLQVTYYYSNDNKNFIKLGTVNNNQPLLKTSKVNDIRYFNINFPEVKARYIKVIGKNMNEPPYWHHATGTPSWIFADEVLIN